MSRNSQAKKQRGALREFKLIIKKVKKQIPKGKKCFRCGECCGPVICSTYEAQQIADYLLRKKLWPKVATNLLRQQKQNIELTCPLLELEDGEFTCLVYPVRPLTCELQGHVSELPCIHMSGRKITDYKWIQKYKSYVQGDNATFIKDYLMRIIHDADREYMEEKDMEKKKKQIVGSDMEDADEKLKKVKEKVVNDG